MKITQSARPAFHPVTIVLETQDEVDRLFALVNHTYLLETTGLNSLYAGLDALHSPGYQPVHQRLDNVISRGTPPRQLLALVRANLAPTKV